MPRQRSRDRLRDEASESARAGDRHKIHPRRDTPPSRGYYDDAEAEAEAGARARAPRRSRATQANDRSRPSQPLPSQEDLFAVNNGAEPVKPKEKPNFANTGLLAAASKAVVQADGSSVTLKYHEPPEARKPHPRDQWKLFVFKGPDVLDTINLSSRSCWLVGRDVTVADIAAEHSSLSKQHAVIQFRFVEKRNEYGDKVGKVRPYLLDLETPNGTLLNKEKVPESRFLELRDKDMIQFGLSTREYVLVLAPPS